MYDLIVCGFVYFGLYFALNATIDMATSDFYFVVWEELETNPWVHSLF